MSWFMSFYSVIISRVCFTPKCLVDEKLYDHPLIGHCKGYGFIGYPESFHLGLTLYYTYVHTCNDMHNYMSQVHILFSIVYHYVCK